MTQQNQNPVTVVTEVEKKPNAFKRFITNHPRKAKAVAITAAVATAGVVGLVVGKKAGEDSIDITIDAPDELESTDYTSEG